MSALYTPQMLALSTELARYPWSDSFERQAEARSTVCGSTIALGLDLNADGQISRLGVKVSACAIGQSSAAILAKGAEGATEARLRETTEAIRRWLLGEGDLPDWPGLHTIAGALPHPGRHGALLLPWDAAIKAISAPQ
ncbi:MAG: iron-sulfur cluster assembly scaffold protein [Pseudomonadota bacterium]